MENMIVIAQNSGASIMPFENNSLIIFDENQLNEFLNMVSAETIKDLSITEHEAELIKGILKKRNEI